MSKNKNTVVIRNRTDYDKLAEAINNSNNSLTKEDIKEAIIEAHKEIEKNKPEQKYISGFYKFVIEFTLWLFIAIGITASVCAIVYIVKNKTVFTIHTFAGFINIIATVEIIAFSIIITIYSGLTLKEIEKSKDANVLSSMFSNLVAFVALIVAAIALVK